MSEIFRPLFVQLFLVFPDIRFYGQTNSILDNYITEEVFWRFLGLGKLTGQDNLGASNSINLLKIEPKMEISNGLVNIWVTVILVFASEIIPDHLPNYLVFLYPFGDYCIGFLAVFCCLFF